MVEDDRPLFWQVARPLPQPRSFTGPVVPPGEAQAYAKAAFTYEVERVRTAVERTRNDNLNIAAYNLGQLVASGHLAETDVFQALYDAGLHVGLTESETGKTILSGLRGGGKAPRDVPERPPGAARAPLSDPEDSPGAPGPPGEGTEGDPLPVDVLYPVLDWKALWADETEEEWICEPLLPARRLVALYSPPKIGKSLLMLELAVAVSRGTEFLGVEPDRPHVVGYVDFENDPRGDVRSRLQDMGLSPDDLDNLRYLSFPRLPYLDTPMGALQLLAWIQHHGIEVVVIDTISRIVQGEENDNDTWLNFYRHTGLALKAHGVAVIRLDHTGKDPTKGMRGGSAKYGDVDAVWSMTDLGDGRLRLECTAHRLAIPQPLLVIQRQADPLRHELQVGAAVISDAIKNACLADLLGLGFPEHPTKREGRDLALRLLREAGKHPKTHGPGAGATYSRGDVAAALRALHDRNLVDDTTVLEDVRARQFKDDA